MFSTTLCFSFKLSYWFLSCWFSAVISRKHWVVPITPREALVCLFMMHMRLIRSGILHWFCFRVQILYWRSQRCTKSVYHKEVRLFMQKWNLLLLRPNNIQYISVLMWLYNFLHFRGNFVGQKRSGVHCQQIYSCI